MELKCLTYMSDLQFQLKCLTYMSGVTNGIEMRHICQALQMDLKRLTYMSDVTNGIEMSDNIVRRYKWN